jgi:putative transposase
LAKLDARKRRWIVRELLKGELTAGVVSETMGVSRQTCYELLRRYRLSGWESLEDGVVGRPSQVLTATMRRRVVEWRRELGIGAVRMGRLMVSGDAHWPADWPALSHQRIQALFNEAGLKRDGKPRGKKPKYVRFERDHSNSLWQADWHWCPSEERWLLAFLDDHSRFLPGIQLYDEATTDNTLSLFEQAGKAYGFPAQVLTDHGTQFTGTNPKAVNHRFPERLAQLGTEHIMGQVRKPTTTGKIERFFFTYEDELRPYHGHGAGVRFYNYGRPHISLDYEVPAVVYGRDFPAESPTRAAAVDRLTSELVLSPRASWRTGGK